MIPFINKKNKSGKLIPWDTSLVHLHSKSKLSLRATERIIEKSKILPSVVILNDLKDENNNPVKSNLVKRVLEESKKKRNQILIIQIKEVKKHLWLFFVNDLRGGRRWLWHKGKDINKKNLISLCEVLLKKQNNNVVFFPHNNATKYFRLLDKNSTEEFIKFKNNKGYFPFTCYRNYLKKFETTLSFNIKFSKILEYLDELESESIHIMREVVAESNKPVMLYSIGKDSAVMLHLAAKAFYPGPIPFPLLHVDTKWKFDMMYQFRDYIKKKYNVNLIVCSNEEGVKANVNPFDHGSVNHTHIMKTEALLKSLTKYKFDIAFGGARRDEEKSRSKERVLSFRNSSHKWDPQNQRPELWNLYNTKVNDGESIRAFPISNWTELDVWNYIKRENIDIVPLYFSDFCPVVERNNTLIMIDDERMKIEKNEKVTVKNIRFRTLGCYPLTGAIESRATNLDEVISELSSSTVSERQGRLIDTDEQSSMEKKKIDGYF